MRIAVDARAFTSPAGGVRRYVTELYRAIARIAPETQVIAVGVDAAVDLPIEAERVPPAPSLPTNLGQAISGVPLALRGVAFDLFHAPAYTAPLVGARPLVVTIHDVSYARRPEWYPHRVDALRRAFYRASAQRADRILTDSAFSRSEIVAAYGIDPERIEVVPLAHAALFAPDAATARQLSVLHVGDLHARRNLEMLLDIVIALRRQHRRLAGLSLVLVGVDRGSLAALQDRARSAGMPAALDYRGVIDDAGLAVVYRAAGVFAYPTRYEGFGLPLLEAMACGTPVVASSAASVPEVVGPDMPTLDPDDARGWRDAIARLLTDPAAGREASARGLARATGFSWDRTAARTLAVMQSAVQRISM